MIELEEEKNRKVKCMLVGEPGNNLSELQGLTDTLGMETVKAYTLSRLEVQPAYGMGKGKAQEIVDMAHETEADCIIFDFNLILILYLQLYLILTLSQQNSATGKNYQKSHALTGKK